MDKGDIIIAGIMALSYIGFIVYVITGHAVLNKWGGICFLGILLLIFIGDSYLPSYLRFLRFSIAILFAGTIMLQVNGPYYDD